jgi:hypothetical protein
VTLLKQRRCGGEWRDLDGLQSAFEKAQKDEFALRVRIEFGNVTEISTFTEIAFNLTEKVVDEVSLFS